VGEAAVEEEVDDAFGAWAEGRDFGSERVDGLIGGGEVREHGGEGKGAEAGAAAGEELAAGEEGVGEVGLVVRHGLRSS
jgi:hypothetical protein